MYIYIKMLIYHLTQYSAFWVCLHDAALEFGQNTSL